MKMRLVKFAVAVAPARAVRSPRKATKCALASSRDFACFAAATLFMFYGNGLTLEFLMVHLHDVRGISLTAAVTPLAWSLPMIAVSALVSGAALPIRLVLPEHTELPPAERAQE